MSSLNFESNFDEVITIVVERLESIDIAKMTALQASTVMAAMRKRIHVEGKDTNESQIGIYTPSYIKVRTGLYGNAIKAKKGVKSAGEKTKGANKGAQRTKFQRSPDPKVILSLTSQMESDMILFPFEKGCGIGYSNTDNFQKSHWNEKTYKKKIFSLTKTEKQLVTDTGQEYVNETLK